MPQDISSLISTNLHPHDSRLWPSQHSHIPVCMLVASTDSRPTGVAAQHLLNLGNSQQPWAAARPKWSSQFLLSPWNVSTNPHLAFMCASQDNQLADRCVLRKLPWSQHWPSLIMSTRLKVPANSNVVKCWNCHKADWKCFCLAGESVERLPPPNTTNIDKACQELCKNLLLAAKQCSPCDHRKNCGTLGQRVWDPLSLLPWALVRTDSDGVISSLP